MRFDFSACFFETALTNEECLRASFVMLRLLLSSNPRIFFVSKKSAGTGVCVVKTHLLLTFCMS